MSESTRQKLLDLICQIDTLLTEVRQQMVVTNDDPIRYFKLGLDQAHLTRMREQFENHLRDLEAGMKVPEIGDVSLQSSSEVTPPNPFNQIGIVTKKNFIGRKDEIRCIKEALDSKSSIIIIGPPKIGKTSLMWQILEAYRESGRTILYLDFKLPHPINYHYAELTRLLGKSGDTIADVAKALDECEVTLFVDEFDFAVKRGLDSDHLYTFRGLALRGYFQMIAVSSKPAKEIYPGSFDSHSLPYSFLAPELLEAFSPAEANTLFETYLGKAALLVKTEDRTKLIELTNGHPFKLQRAAYRFYEWLVNQNSTYNWRKRYELDIANML
jgi:hypothetical protein